MRTKSLTPPANPQRNDEWFSPDSHAPHWHRVWNGTAWELVKKDSCALLSGGHSQSEGATDETKNKEETSTSTEETKGEQRNETTVSDRDGQQKPDVSAKQPAAGEQVKGGQGKRRK